MGNSVTFAPEIFVGLLLGRKCPGKCQEIAQNSKMYGIQVGSKVGCEIRMKIYLRNLILLYLHHFLARNSWAIM